MASDALPFVFKWLSQKELYGIAPVVCKVWNTAAEQAYDVLMINLLAPNDSDDVPRQFVSRTEAQILEKAKQVAAWMSKNGQYVQRLTIETKGIAMEELWSALGAHGPQLQLTKLTVDIEDPLAAEGLSSALTLVCQAASQLTSVEIYSTSQGILAAGRSWGFLCLFSDSSKEQHCKHSHRHQIVLAGAPYNNVW